MKTKLLDTHSKYTGEQLRPLTNYLEHGLLGNSAVAWFGPCEVTPEHMIDGEDLRAGAQIAADEMLHIIVELYDVDLKAAIVLQRLMAEQTITILQDMNPAAKKLRRQGDDIYAGQNKLNISIATKSTNSTLIHFAINTIPTGAPVPILSLQDLNIPPKTFANTFLNTLATEFEDILEAYQKVRTF